MQYSDFEIGKRYKLITLRPNDAYITDSHDYLGKIFKRTKGSNIVFEDMEINGSPYFLEGEGFVAQEVVNELESIESKKCVVNYVVSDDNVFGYLVNLPACCASAKTLEELEAKLKKYSKEYLKVLQRDIENGLEFNQQIIK